MNFEIHLAEKQPKTKHIIILHLIVCFLLLISGVFSVLTHYFIVTAAGRSADLYPSLLLLKWAGVISALLGIMLFGIILFENKWLLQKSNNLSIRIAELIVFTSFTLLAAMNGMTYTAVIYGLAAAVLLYAVYWETRTGSLSVCIGNDGVKLPVSSRKRHLQWREIQNIMLRFGMLTIDCHDNRLYQWDIKTVGFDKEVFQSFCTEHIRVAENKGKRDGSLSNENACW